MYSKWNTVSKKHAVSEKEVEGGFPPVFDGIGPISIANTV